MTAVSPAPQTALLPCPDWCQKPPGHFNAGDDAGWRLHERLIQEVSADAQPPEYHSVWLTLQAEERDGVVAEPHLAIEVARNTVGRKSVTTAFLDRDQVVDLAAAILRGRTFMHRADGAA